jgi:DNA-binding response OmpR family regulator
LRHFSSHFPIINKKQILIINVQTVASCTQILAREQTWKVRQTNLSRAFELIKKQYIDLLCIETTSSSKEIFNLLKSIKDSNLDSKILAIIPNNPILKESFLQYGCDDYLSIPYSCEDLLLRCRKLIKCMPMNYSTVYKNNYLSYERTLKRVMYKNTYIPLTQTEILIIILLIKNSSISKSEINKYLYTRLGKDYSDEYINLLIHRIRRKIKLCTGRNPIRNRYGYGYYLV